MKLEQNILNRLDEMIAMGQNLLQSASVTHRISPGLNPAYLVDNDSPPMETVRKINLGGTQQWEISCLNILQKACGKESPHYLSYQRLVHYGTYEKIEKGVGALRAAKNDAEAGYLFDTRVLIEAEVLRV